MTVCPLSSSKVLRPAKNGRSDSEQVEEESEDPATDDSKCDDDCANVDNAPPPPLEDHNIGWKDLEDRLEIMEREVVELQQRNFQDEQILRKKIKALKKQQVDFESEEKIQAMNREHARRIQRYHAEIEEIKVSQKTSVMRNPLIRPQVLKVIHTKHANSHEDALTQIRAEIEEGTKKLDLFAHKVQDNLKEQDKGLAEVLEELCQRVHSKQEEVKAFEKEHKTTKEFLSNKVNQLRHMSKECKEPPLKGELQEEISNAKVELTRRKDVAKKAQQSLQVACCDAISSSQAKMTNQEEAITTKRAILLQRLSDAEAQLNSLKDSKNMLDKQHLQKLEMLNRKNKSAFNKRLQLKRAVEKMGKESARELEKASRKRDKFLLRTLEAWNKKGEEFKQRASRALSGLQCSVQSQISLSKKAPLMISDAYDWDEVGRLLAQIERERLRLDMLREKQKPQVDIDAQGFQQLLLPKIEQKVEKIKLAEMALQDLEHQTPGKAPPPEKPLSSPADTSLLKRKVEKLSCAIDTVRKHLSAESERLGGEIISREKALRKEQETFLTERQRLYKTVKDEQDAYSDRLRHWITPVKHARAEHQKLLSRGSHSKPDRNKEEEIDVSKVLNDLNNKLFVVDAYNLGADLKNDRLQQYYEQLQNYNAKLVKQLERLDRRRKMVHIINKVPSSDTAKQLEKVANNYIRENARLRSRKQNLQLMLSSVEK